MAPVEHSSETMGPHGAKLQLNSAAAWHLAVALLLLVAVTAAAELEAVAAFATDDECVNGPAQPEVECGLHTLQRRALAARPAERLMQRPPSAGGPASAGHVRLPEAARDELQARLRTSRTAAVSPDSQDALGEALLNLLKAKLPVINEQLKARMPDFVAEVYSSSSSDKICCFWLPWSSDCSCYCDVLGAVEVRNLTGVKTLSITELQSISTNFDADGGIQTSVVAEMSASGLAAKGKARGSAGACGLHFPTLYGSVSATVSVRDAIVTLHGTVVVQGDARVCLKSISAHLVIPANEVEYINEVVTIGGWQILKLEGNFWDKVVHHLPAEPLIDSLAAVAGKAIPEALAHESLCV